MPYTGVLIDGSVTNAKIATGTISGDRLGANFTYAGDMTVQRLCANKCLTPAICAYSCCCYGGHFYGACGICACGCTQGAIICGYGCGIFGAGYSGYGGSFCSYCGTALCATSCCGSIGSFYRCNCCYVGYTICEWQSIMLGYCGSALCASYSCCETSGYTCRYSSVILGYGDCGLYTTNKAYIGGGLILAGCAGNCEGAITICGGCMCYYSGGVWHPVCKVV